MNNVTRAKITNDRIKILTTIDAELKRIYLVGFHKQQANVRGRCELKKFLESLRTEGHIKDDYIIEVSSPTPIDGKTLNNTFKMYEKMGFKREQKNGRPDKLKEKVNAFIGKLSTCNVE